VNGVHDMGGMHGFGPVRPEPNEPRFHAPWERRVLALTLAMGATGRWNIDMTRAARESIAPARYLAATYYEIWYEGLCRLLVAQGLATADELRDGRLRTPPAPDFCPLAATEANARLAAGSPTARTTSTAARFAVGDTVRAQAMNPTRHTRLPRYCRGKRGTIVAAHGAHVFADAHASGQGEAPQWLYTVSFDARELWGDDTTASSVRVDCWESYLEKA